MSTPEMPFTTQSLAELEPLLTEVRYGEPVEPVEFAASPDEVSRKRLRERITSRAGRAVMGTVTALSVLAGAGSVVAAEAPAAHASAVGCVRWGQKRLPLPPPLNVSIPTGQYCFGVNGSGQRVNWTDGSINTPFIVNYTEMVRFYDSYGDNYATFREPVHPGNSYGFHYWSTGIHGTARVGRVCGTLLSEGVEIATACEGIK